MKVLVITGGTTSERCISFMSARQVKKGLEETGHKVKLYDLKKGQISRNLVKNFDVVFPVLHGEEGEGGNLQKTLSALDIPFIGGAPKGFKQGWYKIPFKKFCDKNNILTSPWKRVKNQDDIIKFGFPAVLKSTSGGSSREVIILKSAEDLKSKSCQHLLNSGLPLFVERFLPGIEVTVGIFNNQALPVIEIIPPEGRWFNYKNKYSGETKEIPHAPSLKPAQRDMLRQIALKIHQSLNLGPYSRIDFIVSDFPSHSSSGKLNFFVLEVNTIPGLTSQSLFPKAAQAAGISFPKLLDKMVKLAYESKVSKTK